MVASVSLTPGTTIVATMIIFEGLFHLKDCSIRSVIFPIRDMKMQLELIVALKVESLFCFFKV